jgi:cathepsin F
VYATEEETSTRFSNFKRNLAVINRNNMEAQATGGAIFGVNKFSDLSADEFRLGYLNNAGFKKSDLPKRSMSTRTAPKTVPFTNWDWAINKTGIVTAVKNQESCGSCWAFSATETIESIWALAGNPIQTLAPQQIVDCDKVDDGCGGGWTYHAYEYIINAGGMMPESAYPYKGVDGTCKYNPAQAVANIGGWEYINIDPTSENSTMLSYVAYTSPVSVCVDASSWQLYTGNGILMKCGLQIDHCVQVTGFQLMAGNGGNQVPVWNVRNSWGADWGANGYIFLERNKDLCAIATVVTVPQVY